LNLLYQLCPAEIILLLSGFSRPSLPLWPKGGAISAILDPYVYSDCPDFKGQWLKTAVGVEEVAFRENSSRLGDSRCPPESKKSLVGHSGATGFLTVSRG
jgi:hypothetical protein